MYTLLSSATSVFCDMTDGGVGYLSVSMGDFNTAGSNYTLVSLSDLQNPVLQQAFVALFNLQDGLPVIATWTPNNCCWKYDTSTTNYLTLNGQIVFTEALNGTANDCGTHTAGTKEQFQIETSPVTNVAPDIATSFFTTNPPGTSTICGTADNPAFFWEKVSP